MTPRSTSRLLGGVADLVDTAIAVVDADGTYLYLNRSFERIFPEARPEVGQSLHDVADYEANRAFFDALTATFADGQTRRVRNDSRQFGRVFESVITLHDAAAIIEVTDVTGEVREAEGARRLDEARRIMSEHTDSDFMLVDVVGRSVVSSETVTGLWLSKDLGAAVAEGRVLEGLHASTTCDDPWQGLESARDGRVLRAIAEVFTSGVAQQHVAVVPVGPDSVRHLDIEWVPWAVDGMARGVIMMGHDTTQQRLAEHRESVAAATMQELLERLPVTLWEIDIAERLAWPLFPDRREISDPMWGRPAPVAATFSFLSAASIELLVSVLDDMTESSQVAITVDSADDQRRLHLSLSSVDPVADRVLAVITDITDEFIDSETDRRMDHAKHVMRFAQGVAHDFGNLAQVIGGYSELLARTQDPVLVEQASSRLQSAATRAVEVSRRIAMIAKVQQVVNGPVDVSELIEVQVADLRGELGQAVHLSVACEPGLVAYAEHLQVSSMIDNLCLNAAEAMGYAGRIHVSAQQVIQHGRSYVEVAVADDGPGVPANLVDRVFEPFVSGRPALGTGLGLYLIQEYLHSVGGQVRVENSDRGATFRVLFQAARGVPRESAPASVRRTIRELP